MPSSHFHNIASSGCGDVCMCVHVCVCIWKGTYMCTCVYMCAWVCDCVCMHDVCICVCMCTLLCFLYGLFCSKETSCTKQTLCPISWVLQLFFSHFLLFPLRCPWLRVSLALTSNYLITQIHWKDAQNKLTGIGTHPLLLSSAWKMDYLSHEMTTGSSVANKWTTLQPQATLQSTRPFSLELSVPVGPDNI